MRSADNEGKARKRRAPATHKMAGDCEGVSRAPGLKDPKWFIPGLRDERKSTGSGDGGVRNDAVDGDQTDGPVRSHSIV